MSLWVHTRRLAPVLLLTGLLIGGLLLALDGLSRPALAAPAPFAAAETDHEPAAPQVTPPPWLSDPDVADAPYAFRPAVSWAGTDGQIAPSEYGGAHKLTFEGYGGEVEAFIWQDTGNLYIAFDSPDTSPFVSPGPALQVFLDTLNDKATAPQLDDYRLTLRKNNALMESRGNGTGWGNQPVSNWTAAAQITPWGWQAEFSIALSKLGAPISMGMALAEVWTPSWPHDWYWPAGADWDEPDTWGNLISSSDWGTFFWKPGPWIDYAPSGLPDFDQNQTPTPTYCGPYAAANSLWWFDAKFESSGLMPPAISDTYRLVTSYSPGAWDDHDPQNVTPLALDLAWYYNTDGIRTGGAWLGTRITDMYSGTLAYLRDHGLWDDYLVTLVEQPSFEWVADEVQRSEDVILLLGFYEELEPGLWNRFGGHYVTVAGVDPIQSQIAFSDPFVDATEAGLALGRVLNGSLIPHVPIPGHPPFVHEDAGNVSHDIYQMLPTFSPGGTWGPQGYPWHEFLPWFGDPINPHPVIPTLPFMGMGINYQVEVEYALAVSPYTWKASGEWREDEGEPALRGWEAWPDYAPSGVPDFDQEQGCWGMPWFCPPDPAQYTFCGPAAVANSLWWFDTQFEPNPLGPLPHNDNYPLVQSYDPAGAWDDHHPLNVDNPATIWPGPGMLPAPIPLGSGELVEELAAYFHTDQFGPGTVITDLAAGIDLYLQDRSLRPGYVITQVAAPEFWWVAEEVEVSEDVIILLGFWQEQGPNIWVRLGGHYVTLPGVDKQGGLVAFSDPWFDRIENTWPYAGIGTWPGWPSYLGRVADGRLTPHLHGAHPGPVHNDAGNISHDVYRVVPTDSPGGVWGPWEYVDAWPSIENFWGQNGQDETPSVFGTPIQAEVEWAVAVSPVADVWVIKSASPAVVPPGGWVTFTLTFGNDGTLPAEDVVLSDTLPAGLLNSNWSYWISNGAAVSWQPGTEYLWDLPNLAWQEWGVITLTAQADPTITNTTEIVNRVEISTSSVEQYQLPELANSSAVTLTVMVTRGVALAPAAVQQFGENGQQVTFSFTVTNTGNAVDSFNLGLSGDDWLTIRADSSVGPLGPDGSATTLVTVTVPLTEPVLAFDQASLTAQSAGDPATIATALFTTTVRPTYALHVNPASDSQSGNPGGEPVIYLLTVHNDGNVTDTYSIAPSGAVWTTTLTHNTLGPLAPGGNDSLEVYVSVPAGAPLEAHDVVTITASSQGGPGVSASSVLTTLSSGQTITRGVQLSPLTANGDGRAATNVYFNLTVTNTGSITDIITLGVSGAWSAAVSPTIVELPSLGHSPVAITVTIPITATVGISETFTVRAIGIDASATSLLTVWVKAQLYLPVVLRN